MQLLKNAAQGVLRQDCMLCGGWSEAAVVCGTCHHSLPRWEAGEEAVAAFEYRFPVDRLVQRFKFAGDLAAGRWLALQLAERVAGQPRPDLLVAPPLTPARLGARGFNQALEIGKVVARSHGLHCARGGIERTRETPPQHGLGRRARRRNLKDAFRCDLQLEGMKVAIVDDVFTTGATAESLARALRRSGAAEVAVWTVARTPAPGRS